MSSKRVFGPESAAERMPVEAALQTLATHREPEQVVITNQTAARLWPHYSNSDHDLNYNPSTMGGAVPLGLGIALAQPAREVIVVSGDGALLMSLGSLVTVVGCGCTNVTVVVMDNGAYEVTGGQRTPAAGTAVRFADLARAVGFPTVAEFSRLEEWQRSGAEVLAAPGPRFLCLQVQLCEQRPTPAGAPLREQMERLHHRLTGGEDLPR